MERADFIHLVRLSEHASADNSQAYRRSVAGFAALGYLWVVGCFVLAVTLLAWTLIAMVNGRIKGFHIALLIAGGGLLWTSLRALWLRLEAPQGTVLTAADAPPLFEALERIRRKTKGPAIDHVLLDSSFNASISQLPRYGLFGGGTNYLTIGLPLLLAIDRPRFLAVMAHEYGHLRGGHGQFAAWIYRTRLSWMKLEHGLRNDTGPMAMATQAFLRWYFPRFLAKTFALARQDEFEADRIAGKLVGRDIAGAALTEIAIKGSWLSTEFWPLHWGAAATSPQPTGPFTAMRTLLAQPVDNEFARIALRQSLIQLSDEDDTHPVLRDRLEALNVSKQLPNWSTRPATDLLGPSAVKWLAHFDRQWCKDNATEWKLHHAYLQRVQARIATLMAGVKRNNADEMAQLGDLQRRLDAGTSVRACYERALQITPGHAGALRGMVNCLPDTELHARMDCLRQLFESSVAHRWWACRMAVRALEKSVAEGSMDDKPLKLWRERLKQADEAEQRAWEELTETPFFQSIARHDLDDFEKGEFQSDMARCKPVIRAWLVRKTLKEFAYRRCYILFIDLPGMPDEDRYTLCRSLERTLDLPGPVLVLWAGYSPTLDEIQKNAFDAVYVRALT
ncbi:MAG: M48 family metallopeptidase [Pseudomonadota bacterium]